MMKFWFLVFLFLITAPSFEFVQAQEITSTPLNATSLIQQFRSKKISREQTIHAVKALIYDSSELREPIKCGNPLLLELGIHEDELFTPPASLLKSNSNANSSPVVAETYLSPSGKFRLDYFRSGSDSVRSVDLNKNAIPDFIERAAKEIDFVWQVQIQQLGFRDPLVGINPYPILFRNTGNFYGFTSSNGKSITIHSTFDGFSSYHNDDPEGYIIGDLKVTLAHEFKHAIQYRYNNLSANSHSWAEMDATLLEEVTYDEVNDYYNYLKSSSSIYRNPQNPIFPGTYHDVTFALYFHEKYGSLFWTSVWTKTVTKTSDFLTALDLELQERGTTLKSAFAEMAMWHFYSGARTITNYGFDEASFYPNLKLQKVVQGSFSQIQGLQYVYNSTFQICAVARASAQGFINTGMLFNGQTNSVYVMSKTNPNFGQIDHQNGEKVHFFETQANWSSVDTLFFLVPFFSNDGSPLSYQLFTMADNNPGILTLGDIDGKDGLTLMDVRHSMRAILKDSIVTGSKLWASDVTQNSILSGFDAAKSLEILNNKKAFFEIDTDQNGKTPELNSFRAPLAKQQTFSLPDSLILLFEPLNAVNENARIQIKLDYGNSSFAQSIEAKISYDTLNLQLLDITEDSFLDGIQFDYVQKGNEIHLLLIADEALPSGPILTMRFNRKTDIKSTTFSFSSVFVNEISSLPLRTNILTTEIPTKVGVFVDQNQTIIDSFELLSNFPNPFNPSTTIRFSNPTSQKVRLEVFNSIGQRVGILLNKNVESGIHTIPFDASRLASGVYLVRLINLSGEQSIQKITLMK